MASSAQQTAQPLPGNFRLWLGVLGPPLAWMVQQESVYALAQAVCLDLATMAVLHGVSAICLLICVGGGALSMTNLLQTGKSLPTDHESGHLGRGRLLGALGGLTGIVFLLLIIAQWMAVCLLKPCPTYE